MLNRATCIQEMTRLRATIFPRNQQHLTMFQDTWKKMSLDPTTKEWALKISSNVSHPLWFDELHNIVSIGAQIDPYSILAVDGSQIYPDRHLSTVTFFLINAGGCLLSYNKPSSAKLFNHPTLFLADEFLPEDIQLPFTPDLVDAKREEIELAVAHEYALKNPGTTVLFDGSLIFWHLESKPTQLRDLFLGAYLKHLLAFMNDKILMAGYISMPKSKELVNLVRTKICHEQNDKRPCFGKDTECPCIGTENIVDASILEAILKPFQRTNIFINRSKISEHYPPKLRPCFFYLHTGKEIARIEIPYWIASDEVLITKISQQCLNQALKGDGYPVVLAEAHEQAVIKGNDRLFFYQILETMATQEKSSLLHSQKSIKKRGLGV